jgi:hypothetical protein
MKNITTTFAVSIILTLLTINTYAQEEKKLMSGNSLNIFIPQGTLAETYDHGYGIYANFDYNLNKYFAVRGDFGWNDVSGPETSYLDTNGVIHTNHPNRSIWEFTAGMKAQISIVYIEARGGYFSSLNEWGVVPAVGLRIKKFDLQGSYSIVGDYEWASIRIGYYWGK